MDDQALDQLQMLIEGEMNCLPGRVILSFPTPKRTSESGLLVIPDRARLASKNIGRVVAVGPAITDEDALFGKIVKVGDYVFAYPDYGKEFEIELGESGDALKYFVFQTYEIFFSFGPEGNKKKVIDGING